MDILFYNGDHGMRSSEISFTARAFPCKNYDKITGKIPYEYHMVLIKTTKKKEIYSPSATRSLSKSRQAEEMTRGMILERKRKTKT